MTAALPVFDPNSPFCHVTVRKGSKDTARNVTHLITGFKFVDSGTDTTSKVELTMDAEDGTLWGDDLLMRKGALLSVQFGYPGVVRVLGDFAIRKVQKGGRASATIIAFLAERNRMMRHKRTRTFKGMKDSDVAEQVMRESGISRFFIDDTRDVLPTITQTNEHDWAFLQRRANANGYELHVDQQGGHFEKPKRKQRPQRVLRYVANVLGAGVISDYDIEDFSADVPGRIIVTGYDPVMGEEFHFSIDASNADLEPLAKSDDVTSPDAGDADGGNTGTELVIPSGARTMAEAKKEAKSLFKKYHYGATKIRIKTVGDPFLASRTVIIIEDIGPHLDGYWWVKNVEHSIGSGYKTEATCTKDGLRQTAKTPLLKPDPQNVIEGNKDEIYGKGNIRDGLEGRG